MCADQVVSYSPSAPGPQYEEQQTQYDIAASQIAILAGIMYTGAAACHLRALLKVLEA